MTLLWRKCRKEVRPGLLNTITQPSAKGNAPDQGVFAGVCYLVALLSTLSVVRAGETGVTAYQEVSKLLDDDTRQKFALEYEIHDQGTARVLGADFAPLSGATVGPYVFEAKRKGGLSWTHRLTVTTEWTLVDRNGREIEPGIRPGEEVKIREIVKTAEILPLTGATCAVSVEDAVKRAQSILAEIKSLSLVDLPLSWTGGTMIRSQSVGTVRKVAFKSSAPAFYLETQADDNGVPVFLFFQMDEAPDGNAGQILERRFYLHEGEVRRSLEKVVAIPAGGDRTALIKAAASRALTITPQAARRIQETAVALMSSDDLEGLAKKILRAQRRLQEPAVPLDFSAWSPMAMTVAPVAADPSVETCAIELIQSQQWLPEVIGEQEDLYADEYPAAPGHAKVVVTFLTSPASGKDSERYLLELEKTADGWKLTRSAGYQHRRSGETTWQK